MFKMFSPTIFIIPVAWLALFIWAALGALTPLLGAAGIKPGLSWAVLVVELIALLIFSTSLWRRIWRRWPSLARLIYPDLNGEWDVHLQSNWSRIVRTLDAAAGTAGLIDMRTASETELPPLERRLLRARIIQSWLSMKMELWDPEGGGPVDKSKTLLIEPLRGKDGRHGLAYVFEQENSTDSLADDVRFRGAAMLELDRGDPGMLVGRMWTDRVWRRGMNTAANVRFIRSGD